MKLKELMNSEQLHLKKLQDLVELSIKEEQQLTDKLIQAEQDCDMTFGQRVADTIAEWGGSWTFIIGFLVILFAWIALNLYLKDAFDPYPFILMNLILSCLAALQAPVIMMSQKRQDEKDRRAARNDYLINMKAEIEVRNLHSKIDLLITEQMKSLFEIQKVELSLLEKLEKQILNAKK